MNHLFLSPEAEQLHIEDPNENENGGAIQKSVNKSLAFQKFILGSDEQTVQKKQKSKEEDLSIDIEQIMLLPRSLKVKRKPKEEMFEDFILNLLGNTTASTMMNNSVSRVVMNSSESSLSKVHPLPLNETFMLSTAKKNNLQQIMSGYEYGNGNEVGEMRGRLGGELSSVAN